jgi:hypothetical protein
LLACADSPQGDRPPIPDTFERYEDARRWAEQAEGLIASGDALDLSEARRTTLGEALARYLGVDRRAMLTP